MAETAFEPPTIPASSQQADCTPPGYRGTLLAALGGKLKCGSRTTRLEQMSYWRQIPTPHPHPDPESRTRSIFTLLALVVIVTRQLEPESCPLTWKPGGEGGVDTKSS